MPDPTLNIYSGPWNEDTALQLLKRTLYGPTRQEIKDFAAMDLQTAVSTLLQDLPHPSPPVNNYNTIVNGGDDPDVPEGQTWITAPRRNNTEYPKRQSLKSWLFDQMMFSPANIHTKMVHFWHNLLVTETGSVSAKLAYQYFDLLHEYSLGNYKSLIKKITLNPAMLIYLNGNLNIRTAPDENYARELQELFCVGKGPDSGYTEGDVQTMARLLTGWYARWNQYIEEGIALTFFEDWRHDPSDKIFSSFYNSRRITGREGRDGAEAELDEALDMIFETDEVAKHICRKLFQFFIHSEISPEAETEVIVPLANMFRDSGYEIKVAVEGLLTCDYFYKEEYRGSLVKSPLEFLMGTWRTLGMNYNNPSDPDEIFHTHNTMVYYLDKMGMNYGDPPNVAGWPAYYQLPLTDKAWITTDTITFRAQITDIMANYGLYVNNNGETLWIITDYISFVKTLDNPDDPNLMLDEVSQLFLGIPLMDEPRAELRSILLSGQDEDFYWWDAWNSHINFPNDEMYRVTVENRLRPMFRTLFQLGEFNLM